jgi:hypothetical protein
VKISIEITGDHVAPFDSVIKLRIRQPGICFRIPSGAKIRRGADKPLAFPIFLLAARPKEFLFGGLKKLEQRSHKYVELRGNM